MGQPWPSGLARIDVLSLDAKDRRAIVMGLRDVLRHTRRSQEACVERRGYSFKFGRTAEEAQWKAQHEAYQRGINRLQRLITLFLEDT